MARFGSTVLTLAVIFATVFAGPVAALAQTPAPSGGRDVFSVSDCTAPITLRFVGAIKPAAIRTGDIAPRPAASPPGWTIEWEKPAADDTEIGEYVSTGRFKEGCPAPGLYSVPLTVYGEDHSEGPLALTVVRVVDPVLDIPASVTLSAERLWGAPAPVPLLLRETVAGAPDARISVLGGELKTAAGEPTGIALEPGTGTVIVKAGESARVMLAPTDAPAPGAYTARLVLNGAAVKPGTTIDVTYKVRVARYYLLAVIALGIALGLLVNVYLAGRAALDAALLAGLHAMQALTRRATPQRDPAVQQRLLAVANLLQSNLEDSTQPDEVTKRVDEAEAQAKDIENKAVEAASALLQALTVSRNLFRPNGQDLDALLTTRLAAPLADLDTLQRAADGGDIEQTTARLQDFSRDLPTRVVPLVQGFLADARTELQALGPLPDGNDLATPRDTLCRSIEDAYPTQDPAIMIKASDDIARRLRAWMDLTAPEALASRWRQAARVLTAAPALAQRLSFAADQAEQLRRTARDPLERLGTLGQIGKTVISAMTDAAPGDADVADALAMGNVVAAARRLAGQPVGQMQMQLEADQAVASAASTASSAMLAVDAPVAVLRIKPLVPLGQDSMLVLRWIGVPPSPDRVTWQCNPPTAATLQPGPVGAIVRPSEAGFLTVFLEVDKVRIAEVRTYAGEIADEGIYTVAAREGRFARTAITVATALITAFAGYEIFVPTWFGTVGDCFGAFLWGFFGQFGLDRVRELAKPLLSRTLPG